VGVRLRVETRADVAPPRTLLELRDEGGLVLGSVTCETAALGWSPEAGLRELRFDLERLPLADGRFHLRLALVDPGSGRLLHSLDDAARFFVFPTGDEDGAVLLDGRWSLQENAAPTQITRA